MPLVRLLAGAAAFLAAVAVPFYAHSYSNAPPPGYTGHVLDGTTPRTCAVCHDSFELNSGTGGVAITAPATVTPSQTVPITISVTNTTTPAPGSTPRQGFEATVRTHAEPLPAGQGDFAGTLTITDPVNTGRPLGNDANYVGHTATGTAQSSWTFDWTAPATGGAYTVYATGNAANNGDGPSGDYIYTARFTINVVPVAGEERPEPAALALGVPMPNPARDAATVRLTLAEASVVQLRLVDGLGRTVRVARETRLAAGTHPLRLNVSGLAPGTYFVEARAGDARQTQPVVVAR